MFTKLAGGWLSCGALHQRVDEFELYDHGLHDHLGHQVDQPDRAIELVGKDADLLEVLYE
jgi:hypothetical protein